LHKVAAGQAEAQVDLDQASATVAWLQATLRALQRAQAAVGAAAGEPGLEAGG